MGTQLTHEEGANPEHSAVPEHSAAAGSPKRPQAEMDGGVTCSEWDFYTSLLPEGVSRFFSESVVGKKAQGNTNSHNFSLSLTHTLS